MSIMHLVSGQFTKISELAIAAKAALEKAQASEAVRAQETAAADEAAKEAREAGVRAAVGAQTATELANKATEATNRSAAKAQTAALAAQTAAMDAAFAHAAHAAIQAQLASTSMPVIALPPAPATPSEPVAAPIVGGMPVEEPLVAVAAPAVVSGGHTERHIGRLDQHTLNMQAQRAGNGQKPATP